MSIHEKTTDELLNEIKNGTLERFIEQNEHEFTEITLHEYICRIIKDNGLKKSRVVARSGLNRIYAYQIFAGKRMPSRDKLMVIGFGLQLDHEGMDKLLRQAGYSPLYARSKRDSIIIHAIVHSKSIFAVNEMLFDNGFEILTS